MCDVPRRINSDHVMLLAMNDGLTSVCNDVLPATNLPFQCACFRIVNLVVVACGHHTIWPLFSILQVRYSDLVPDEVMRL